MSGMNLAWHHYGMDFGNGRYDCCTGSELENYLDRVANEGGNSIRIWIHCDAESTPHFDGDGYVLLTDQEDTMIDDLLKFLNKARSRNILVFPVLWNGAIGGGSNYRNLFYDDDKLQSYIDNAINPLVNALAGHQAIGAWEIMNEPEGFVQPASHSERCFDSSSLIGSGAGWTEMGVPMQNLQKFINWQAAAIRAHDPSALITVGSWNERAQTDEFGYRNFYTDECLLAAGGRQGGTLDVYQIHTYSWQGSFSPTSPFKISGWDYNLDKPLIIGEFSADCSEGNDITDMFNHGYYYQYNGVWSWQANAGGHCSDSFEVQARGCSWLQGRNDQSEFAGGRVNFEFAPMKMRRSWYKRPILIYNPDEHLDKEGL